MTLTENQRAKELGMSRTPIREAIRQMEMEELLDYAPRYGGLVRSPGPRELGEMYSVREALESHAAAAAAQRISPDSLSKIDGLYRNMNAVSLRFQRSGKPFLAGELLRR